MNEDDDDFFSACDADEPTPEAQRALGLVIGPRAEVTLDDKGNVIRDGLAEMEYKFRMSGMPRMIFDEGGD
jgi:hypothetical protein